MDCSLFGLCHATAYWAGELDNFQIFLTPRIKNEFNLGAHLNSGVKSHTSREFDRIPLCSLLIVEHLVLKESV